MKKIFVALLISIICISSICYIEFNVYKLVSTKNESKELLERAYALVERPVVNNQNNNILKGILVTNLRNKSGQSNQNKVVNVKKEEVVCNDEIIGVLLIPKLNIEAPIKDGTTQEIMKTCVGHFTESDYWNGNVSFASHNSGISAHYFEKIKLLNKDDEIIYKTKLGTKKYRVQSVDKIKNTDWSMIVKNTNTTENTITLVTCINRKPEYRLCVRGIEVKE